MLKNGFVKKNVGTLTLGERLAKLRSEKRITLGEVSKGARIQVKYLEYLESGRYEKLPVDVYVKGFLRSYSQYLGADENYFIRLYERERDIHKNVKKEEPKKNLFKPIKFSSLVVTPKAIVAILVFFFVGLGFFYLYRELSIFISKPRLVILSPSENFSTEEKKIKIEGVTEKDAKLFVNGQQLIVNEEGKFFEELFLQPGLNTITIKSVNRFEKESEKIITGEGKFQNISGEGSFEENQENNNQDSSQIIEEKRVKVEVFGDTKTVSISVKTDDEASFNGVISPGSAKIFEGTKSVFVSAEKGKYLRVVLNGKDLGMIGKDTKPASRLFTAQ